MGSRNQRKVQNFLISPKIQFRYGAYLSLFSVALAVLMGSLFYVSLQEDIDFMIQLTDIPEQADLMISERLTETIYFGFLLIIIFGAICFGAGIYLTHRLVGPTVAFRRHIQKIRDGDYDYRTYLRPKDDFTDIAEELNRLSESSKSK